MDKDKVNKINDILTRGVETVFEMENLKKRLLSGKKLRIKLGVDPTSPHIHIGRAVALRKLKAFQDLGHKVVFIVGDFTAQVGDASDKLQKRPMLTAREIKENLRNYKKQVGKIINLWQAEFHYNSRWLSKLSFQEIADLAETFSVQQMVARRNFTERWEKEEEISLREFLYPLMQGYDSVIVKSDVEIGGSDQLFNLMAGRKIQKKYGQQEQDILTLKMLSGTDGIKMSSSWGNIIAIDDSAENMYGKVMSINDNLVSDYFVLATDLPQQEIDTILAGANPKEVKMRLAREIVKLYHGEKNAESSEKNFVAVFSEKKAPENLDEVAASNDEMLSNVLVSKQIISSKSEFARLVKEGAITNIEKNEKITDIRAKVSGGGTYKVGKHRFVKIKV